MWLVRVQQLRDGAGWYDMAVARSNAPFGEIQHWTRAFDCLLLLPSLLLSVGEDFEKSLFVWAVIIGPLLMAATLALLFMGVRAIWSEADLEFGPMLFMTSPAILLAFQVARPDHQSLNLFLLAMQTVLTIRLFIARRKQDAMALALSMAVAMYVSVEALLSMGITLLTLGGAWVVHGKNYDRVNLQVCGWLLIFTFCCALLQNPPVDFWKHTELDALSSIHVLLVALPALFWGALAFFHPQLDSPAKRLGIAAIFVAVTFFMFLWWCPVFLSGPYGRVDSRVKKMWLDGVMELIPITKLHDNRLGIFFIWLGTALAGLTFSVWSVFKEPAKRWIWIYLALLIAGFSALSLFAQNRWAEHAALVAAVPWALCVGRWVGPHPRLRYVIALIVGSAPWLIGAFCLAISRHQSLAPRQSTPFATTAKQPAANFPACATLKDLCNWLNSQKEYDSPQVVMAFINKGPEILYRTRFCVVSTPYHRNTQGILDDLDFFTCLNGHDSRLIALKRRVNLILIEPGSLEEKAYYGQVNGMTLYTRLISGYTPDWMREVLLPEHLAHTYRLYNVSQ
jgi:hypothetical protein